MPPTAQAPDFRTNPHRKLKTLQNEIVPWAPFFDRGDPDQIIENQDEVLNYLARQDERAYVRMERKEAIVRHAMLRRKRTLLSAGWKLEPANNKPAARLLTDYGNEQLKRLRARWATNLGSMHDAIFWGWRPLERVWDFESTFQGKPAWWVRVIREKEPHEFRFTANRDLVWLGNGAGGGTQTIFHLDDDVSRLRWLICTAGSTDKPYGIADLRYVWLLHYLKGEFMRMLSQGMPRSMGLMKITESGGRNASTLAPREAPVAAQAPGGGKDIKELALEVSQVMEILERSNVLIERFGWKVDFSGDVKFADGWLHPIEYLDRMMALCLTGDTISVTAGAIGSRAAVDTKGEELEQLCVADGHEIGGWINEQVLGDGIRVNFPDPDPDDMPQFSFRLGNKMDLDAVKWLFLTGQVDLDAREIAREFGAPIVVDPQEGDILLRKVQTMIGPDGLPVAMPPGADAPKGGRFGAPPAKPGAGGKPPQDPPKPGDKPKQAEKQAPAK